MMLRRVTWLSVRASCHCIVDLTWVNRMSKSKDTKRDQKKVPQKTAKEKKQAKRDKQTKSSATLPNTAGS